MEKPLNIMVFDEESQQQPIQKSNTSMMISKTYSGNFQSTNQLEIIQQQIYFLGEKVRSLESSADAIKRNSGDGKDGKVGGDANHAAQMMKVVEKKMQIVVKETQKLVSKFSQNITQKLSTHQPSQKVSPQSLQSIKTSYKQSLQSIQQHYKHQIEKVNRQYRQTADKMVDKVNQIQIKFINKINQHQNKQKQYVEWIHHLQLELKEKKEKKKMIQVTIEKPVNRRDTIRSDKAQSYVGFATDNYSSTSSHANQHMQVLPNQNIPPASNNSFSPAPSDNSKIQRKRKIFETYNKDSSVSPNKPKTVSPIHSHNIIPPNNQSKVVSPINNMMGRTRGSEPIKQQSIHVKQQSIHHKQQSIHHKQPSPLYQPQSRQSPLQIVPQSPFHNPPVMPNPTQSPWRVIDKSYQNQPTKRNLPQQVNQTQFYKDLPKANQAWQKFQDFKENTFMSDSDSDDEDFVCKDNHQMQSNDQHLGYEFRSNYSNQQNNHSNQLPYQSKAQGYHKVESSKHTANQSSKYEQPQSKVFSPFDLN